MFNPSPCQYLFCLALLILSCSNSVAVAQQRTDDESIQSELTAIQNDEKTFRWEDQTCDSAACVQNMRRLERFALNGSIDAQVIVAMAYATGEGIEQDLDLARQFLKRAISNNDARAWYISSQWLSKGIGYEQDLERAEYAFQRALEQDYPAALFESAVHQLDFEGGDNRAVVAKLERAAEQKHQPSQYLLAQLLAGGVGVSVNRARAIELFTSLSRWNYKESRLRLAAILQSDALQSRATQYVVSDSSSYADVEVIEVSAQRISLENYLEEFALTLDSIGIYDGISTGSRIRGQVCEQGVALCRVQYSRKQNSPAATALGALTGRAGM
ncbi:MAG TPA: tetratricopeptide repeat protein [Pseudidiomarina sp.]|nr:tetratricopeptide repeat protein [Pseudidiomarina sp.]